MKGEAAAPDLVHREPWSVHLASPRRSERSPPTPAAGEATHAASRGVPRLVNQICDYALVYAFTDGQDRIDAGLIEQAGRDAVAAGADFLKTSTGKLQPAATLEAAAILLDVIRDCGRPVGFKAAGGIRDTAGAASYLHLADTVMGPGWATPATFRFGASGLLDALLADLGHGATGQKPSSGY